MTPKEGNKITWSDSKGSSVNQQTVLSLVKFKKIVGFWYLIFKTSDRNFVFGPRVH